MRIKEGVDLSDLQPEMVRACQIIDLIYEEAGYECWITSGREGGHHGQPVGGDDRDPHYLGKAVDFRIHTVPPEARLALVDTIRLALGDRYVVLWENKGTDLEHLHVQAGHVLA